MQKIKIPITADFTTGFADSHSRIDIVQNDLNAYELVINTMGASDNDSLKVAIAYSGGTVTLVPEHVGEQWLCTLPQLPTGLIQMQIGRLRENFLQRVPTGDPISGNVFSEIPDGEIPEPQQQEIDRLIVQLNEALGQVEEAASGAAEAVANANTAVETANEASETANQAAADLTEAAERGDFDGADGTDGATWWTMSETKHIDFSNVRVGDFLLATEGFGMGAIKPGKPPLQAEFFKGDVYEVTSLPADYFSGITFRVNLKGLPGTDGKSAYQSALDGGFPDTRTEAQFNSDLAVVHEKQDELPGGAGVLFRDEADELKFSGEEIRLFGIGGIKSLFSEFNQGDRSISTRKHLSSDASNYTVSVYHETGTSELNMYGGQMVFNANDTEVSLTDDGLSVGNKKISNLSNGAANTDAVNVGQLNQKATLKQATDETDALTQSTNDPNNLYWW